MRQKLDEPVSVILSSSHETGRIWPRRIVRRGQTRTVERLGMHHTYREGRTLMHVFGVIAEGLFYRLVLNSDTLLWRVEEIHDGLPD